MQQDINMFKSTPIETYQVDGHAVIVKREDTCGPEGAPTFSKIRGLFPHLISMKKDNPKLEVVAYVETSVSMAGWGVAWACSQLDLRCIIFDPQYIPKTELPLLRYHRLQWDKWGAERRPIKAGMAKVNWMIARKIMKEEFGKKGALLELGLPLQESIAATADELVYTVANQTSDFGSIVVNVGSGTIAAGLLKGLSTLSILLDNKYSKIPIYGIMGRSGNLAKKTKKIYSKAELPPAGSLFATLQPRPRLLLQDPGWEYTQKSDVDVPFFCHPYYDRKAWEWLQQNIGTIEQPVLFWNIGR